MGDRRDAITGPTPCSRLEADYTAKRCGYSNGTNRIAAEGRWHETRRNGCACSAGRATRHMGLAMRVLHLTVRAVVTGQAEGHFDEVVLAKNNTAGVFHCFDNVGVLLWHKLFERRCT
ncbi:hypothetical protein D3C84_889780 [compost metagenome]